MRDTKEAITQKEETKERGKGGGRGRIRES